MNDERQIVVPEGMLKAAMEAYKICAPYPMSPEHSKHVHPVLEAALCWVISQNPVLGESHEDWIRRLFLASEPEVPEEIKDLLCAGADTVKEAYFRPDIYNERIIKAYRLGQKSK